MSAEKSDAIVLRVVEFSETSCVATLFTRDFGKIAGMAKGAKRRKSPFEGALDVLSIVRLVFLRRNSGGLELLTEAGLERRFRSAATDLGRYYAATYLCELLALFTESNDPHPGLFDAAVDCIGRLDSSSRSPGLELLDFELKLLTELGHAPMLEGCSGCGCELAGGRIHFGLVSGGLLCPKCRQGQKQVIALTEGALRLAKWLQTGGEPRPSITAGDYAQIRMLLNQFENALLGRRPHSQMWLKSVPFADS